MSRPGSASSTEAKLFAEPPATITAILPLDDDPNLRAIHVDGASRCVVRAADVEDLDLAVDMLWSDTVADAVTKRALLVDARQQALRLLGRKAYSSSSLRDKLSTRFAPDVAHAAVDELVDDGWIDDRAVAADLIQTILNRGPAGPGLLREKLRGAGIEMHIADEIIASSIEKDDQIERVTAFMTKQVEGSSVDQRVHARRLAQRLARRGLDEELIARCLEAAGLEISADASDD